MYGECYLRGNMGTECNFKTNIVIRSSNRLLVRNKYTNESTQITLRLRKWRVSK